MIYPYQQALLDTLNKHPNAKIIYKPRCHGRALTDAYLKDTKLMRDKMLLNLNNKVFK